jgi:hypothetical protein
MDSSTETLSRIRNRIAIGELPNKHVNRLIIGPGEGRACDGCGEIISDGTLEIQFEALRAEAGRRLRFHDKCFELWEQETAAVSAR